MASKSFLVDILLNQNELLEAVLDNISGDPTSPIPGQVWYDSNNSEAKFYDGAVKKFAPKKYVDAMEQGLDFKDSVRAATDGSNIDLTSSTDPNPIDGVTLNDGDRVLLKDQTTATENGIYVAVTATDPTSWERTSDANEDSEVTSGMYCFVEEGTNNVNSAFVLKTADPITVGTTSLDFGLFSTIGTSLTAGDGLYKDGSTLHHESATVHESGGALEVTLANLTDIQGDLNGLKATSGASSGDTGFIKVDTSSNEIYWDNGSSLTLIGEVNEVSKYTETLTSGSTSYSITHNLGTLNVTVSLREASSSPYSIVEADVQINDADNITVEFGSSTSKDYQVTITG